MGLIIFMEEAFKLMLKEPKLFIPKIIVAIIYSIPLLWLAYLLVNNAALFDIMVKGEMPSIRELRSISEIFLQLMLISAITFIAFVMDTLVNAMYPTLLRDYYKKKKLSLRSAFCGSLKNTFRILPIGLALVLLVSLPISIAQMYFAKASKSFFHTAIFGLFLTLLGSLFVVAIFYFVYPTIILDDKPVKYCLKKNFNLVKKNKGTVLSASLISLASAIVSLGFSFAAVLQPIFLLLFFLERLLVIVLFTYQNVLNQVVYFGVSK
ncbi:MAG: hypothetical protein N3F05_03465 [Candidatus Diapherotrites archaeon]|nr:hypothetical protein [Candidatus Diapherotrites archaeon]